MINGVIRNEEKKNRHKELYPDVRCLELDFFFEHCLEVDLREVKSTWGPNGHVFALIGWVACTTPDSYSRNGGIFTVGAAGVGGAPTVGVLELSSPAAPTDGTVGAADNLSRPYS